MVLRQRNTDEKPKEKKPQQQEKKKSRPFSGRFNPGASSWNPEHTADKTLLPHSVWTRIVCIVSVAIIILWIGNTPKEMVTLAKQSEELSPRRYQSFACAPAFKREIEGIPNTGCLPTKCGRMVEDGLVNEAEAHSLLVLAKKGLAKGGSSGGASILDLHSGALSKGEQFVNLYKLFPDLFTEDDFKTYRKLKNRVKSAIADHFGIAESRLYLSHPTFFSRITSAPAKTVHDEYWHLHIDKETYPSFHYTSLLYLTDYGSDFQGGRFVFVDSHHDKMNRTVEPRVGRVSAFTSGIENKHFVEPVTGGTRFALTMGFTCDPKMAIPDPGMELEKDS